MPKIPQYNSRMGMSQSAGLPHVNSTGDSDVWRSVSNAGQAMFQIGQKFKKAQITSEVIDASINIKQQMQDLKEQAYNDTNLNDMPYRYQRKLQSLKGQLLKKVSYPEAKNEISNRFDMWSIPFQASINKIYRKKVAEYGKTVSKKLDDSFVNQYIQADDDLQKRQLSQDYIAAKKALLEQGAISQEDFENSRLAMPINIAKSMAVLKPKELMAEVKKGKDGEFGWLLDRNPEQFAEVKKIARTGLDEYRRTFRQDMWDKFLSGQVTPLDVATAADNGDISEKQASQMIKWFKDEFGEPLTINQVKSSVNFKDIVENIAKGQDVDIETMYRDKELSFTDAGKLNAMQKVLSGLDEDRRNVVLGAVQKVSGFHADSDYKSEIYRNILHMAEGENFDAKKVIDSINSYSVQYIHNKYPDTAKRAKLPDLIMGDNGFTQVIKIGERAPTDKLTVFNSINNETKEFPQDTPPDEIFKSLVGEYPDTKVSKDEVDAVKNMGKLEHIKRWIASLFYGTAGEVVHLDSLAAKAAKNGIQVPGVPLPQQTLQEGAKVVNAITKPLGFDITQSGEVLEALSKDCQKHTDDLKKGQGYLGKVGVDVAYGVGSLLPSLFIWETVGTGVKGLVAVGKIAKATKWIPNFAYGGATMTALDNAVKGAGVKKTALRAVGELIALTAFGQLQRIDVSGGELEKTAGKAVVNLMTNIAARSVVAGIISAGHTVYTTVTEQGRLPSYDELDNAVTDGASMVIALEVMQGSMQLPKRSKAIKEVNDIAKKIDEALAKGDMDKANEVVAKAPDEVKNAFSEVKSSIIYTGAERGAKDTREALAQIYLPNGKTALEMKVAELENKGLLTGIEKQELAYLKGESASVNKKKSMSEPHIIGQKKENLQKSDLTGVSQSPSQQEQPHQQNPVKRSNVTLKESNGKIIVTGLDNLGSSHKIKTPKNVNEEIALGIPIFQGGKRNTILTIKKGVEKVLTPEDLNKVTDLYDLFSGSGQYGVALSQLLEMPNLKTIHINELNPIYLKGTKYLHTYPDKVNSDIDWIEKNIQPSIDDAISQSGNKSKSVVKRLLREALRARDDISESTQGFIALLYKNSGRETNAISSITDLMNKVKLDVIAATKLINKAKSKGIEFKFYNKNGYTDFNDIGGDNTLVVADVPYYGTSGYDDAEGTKYFVKANIYRQTVDLIKRLRNKGVKFIYNDSAWWENKEPEDKAEGKIILDNILKNDVNWFKFYRDKEPELLGVYNGREAERNGSIQSVSVSNAGRSKGGTNRERLRGSFRESEQVSGEEGKTEPVSSEPSKKVTNLPKKGEKLYAGIPLDKISEGLKKLGEKVKPAIEGVKRFFVPEKVSKKSWETAMSLRKAYAERARQQELFEKNGLKRWEFFSKLTPEQNIEFIKLIESGKKTGNKVIDSFIDGYRKILDDAYEMSKSLEDKLNYVKDYFPHIFEDKEKAAAFIKQYAMRMGHEKFAKARFFNLLEDALKAGLKLKYKNVEDIVKARYVSALTAKMKADFLNDMEKQGLIIPAKGKDKELRNKGLSPIDTPKGRYYAEEDVARILDRRLNGKSIYNYALGRGWMRAKNGITALKLGLSAFHGIATSISDMTNQLVLSAKKFGRGDLAGGTKALAKVITSPIEDAIKGRKLTETFLKDTLTPQEAEFVNVYTKAGGRVRMPAEYRVNAGNAYKQAVTEGNYIGGTTKLIPAVLEAMQEPILGKYVPWLKVAKFWDTYTDWVESHPDATETQKRDYAAKLQDSLDNRLGELVYDNLFWNQLVKDAGMAMTLSLGWNLGTIREAGGAVMDLTTLVKDYLQGKQKQHYVDRILFTALYPFVAGFIGGLTHWIMSGHQPKSLKDLYFPWTGKYNADGSKERVTLPSYMKDVYSYKNAIRKKGVVKGVGLVASHKTAPMVAMIIDMLRNKNFYGVKIMDEKSPINQKLKDVLAWMLENLTPISVTSMKKMHGNLAPFVGLSKSPAYITRTVTQNRIYDLLSKHYRPDISRTEWNRKQAFREVMDKARQNPDKAPDMLREALKKGILGENEAKAINRYRRALRDLKFSPDVIAFGYLTSDEQKDVWNKMTDKEKAKFYIKLHKNIRHELLNSHILKIIKSINSRER